MVDYEPYVSPAIRTPIHPSVAQIFEAAQRGQLVACAGAGLSRAAPTRLPSGATLGERLNERLEGLVQGYESPGHPTDLIAVADAGSDLEGGEPALRSEVLKLAKFNDAEPNHGHKVMAELLWEGGISLLLLWNWDTCIERVDVNPVRLQVSLSKSDLQNLAEPSIAKVHGCATRPETLLLTSEDLQKPPVWADTATRDHLRGKTVVFIGVGDIADYAKRRLERLREDLEEAEEGDEEDLDIWVVAPEIKSRWAESAWSELLPGLPEERRLEMPADEFLDQLARLWVRDALDKVKAATAEAKEGTQEAVKRVDDGFNAFGSADVLRWVRRAAIGQTVGGSVMFDESLKQLLVALAVITSEADASAVQVRGPAAVQIGEERVEALINCQSRPASRVRESARERAKELANQGAINGEARFLVSGPIVGALADDPDPDLDMTVGEQDVDHLVVGPAAVRLSFLRASALEEAA